MVSQSVRDRKNERKSMYSEGEITYLRRQTIIAQALCESVWEDQWTSIINLAQKYGYIPNPDVGSSRNKSNLGLAASSTPMVVRFLCSTPRDPTMASA